MQPDLAPTDQRIPEDNITTTQEEMQPDHALTDQKMPRGNVITNQRTQLYIYNR